MKERIIESAELSGQRFVLNLSATFSGSQGGVKFGPRTGQSLEFVEHRDYQPGDDIRHLDWNAVARSDKLAIKLFKEEVAPHLDVFVDLSASMAVNAEKFNALTAIVAIMRKASINAGYTCDNWLVKDLCRRVEPSNLEIGNWSDFVANHRESTGATLSNFPPRLRKGAARLLISDLFWNQDPLSVLQPLSDGATSTIVIQLVSKTDIEPQIYGNMRIIDSESREALELICDEAIIAEYKTNFERHRQYWKECCTKVGASFNYLEAEDLLKDFMPNELIKNQILVLGR